MESHEAGGVMETLQTKLTSNRTALRPQPSDPRLPAWRDGFGPRCIRGSSSSSTSWSRRGQRSNAEDRPDPCATVSRAAVEPGCGGQNRSVFPHHPPHRPRRGTGGIQDFSGQSGRLRQSCHPARMDSSRHGVFRSVCARVFDAIWRAGIFLASVKCCLCKEPPGPEETCFRPASESEVLNHDLAAGDRNDGAGHIAPKLGS